MCKRFRIDNTKRVQHSALIDCELLSKVYVNLIDQKEPKLVFNDSFYENTSSYQKNDYSKKIVKPSSLELEAHKNFLKSELKKNYY